VQNELPVSMQDFLHRWQSALRKQSQAPHLKVAKSPTYRSINLLQKKEIPF